MKKIIIIIMGFILWIIFSYFTYQLIRQDKVEYNVPATVESDYRG